MVEDWLFSVRQAVDGHLQDLTVGIKRRDSVVNICRYVKGLMARVGRKNTWQLAAKMGDKTPYNLQYLLYSARFDVELMQRNLQKKLLENLGQNGVLTFDDTGFLKKGTHSAGVQRQYTGTAGRVENCQIGVFMGYKTDSGHALINGMLYLPEGWTNDPERCAAASIPAEVKFQKKPLQALQMYKEFIAQGGSAAWVTADEAYGKDPDFVQGLEFDAQNYVLAIARDTAIVAGGLRQKLKAENWAKAAASWEVASAGLGSKGERLYEWLLLPEIRPHTAEGKSRFLLVRRALDTKECAYYRVYADTGVSLTEIVRAAGSRWSIEECFEMAKGEAGLDDYEVRSYHGWRRHIVFSMWALMLLVLLRPTIEAISAPLEEPSDFIDNEENERETTEDTLSAFKKKHMEESKFLSRKRRASSSTC